MSSTEYVDLDNDGVVDWWETRRAWGFIIGIIGMLASFANLSIDQSQLIEIVMNGMTTAGLIIAFIGGINAKKPISKTSVLPGVDIATIKSTGKLRNNEPVQTNSRKHKPGKSDVDAALGNFSGSD